jgi:hypothetical protein
MIIVHMLIDNSFPEALAPEQLRTGLFSLNMHHDLGGKSSLKRRN